MCPELEDAAQAHAGWLRRRSLRVEALRLAGVPLTAERRTARSIRGSREDVYCAPDAMGGGQCPINFCGEVKTRAHIAMNESPSSGADVMCNAGRVCVVGPVLASAEGFQLVCQAPAGTGPFGAPCTPAGGQCASRGALCHGPGLRAALLQHALSERPGLPGRHRRRAAGPLHRLPVQGGAARRIARDRRDVRPRQQDRRPHVRPRGGLHGQRGMRRSTPVAPACASAA